MTRERKRAPHLCAACGARFDVCYFDDRLDDAQDSAGAMVEVFCPRCQKPKTVSVPRGAERTLVVELNEAEADEGGGD